MFPYRLIIVFNKGCQYHFSECYYFKECFKEIEIF